MIPESILPTPAEMKHELDRHVVGQDSAKEQLCTAVYAHYLKGAAARAAGAGCGGTMAMQKENVLLLGPTGCGKTLLARCLAKVIAVPFAHAVATRLSEVGYVGDNPESVVQLLVEAARGDVAAAEGGILFIDEIDKLRRQDSGGRDVSGQGVQQALLSIIEGARVRVQLKDGPRDVDTSNVLVICSGAFEGLDDVVRERLGRDHTIGFGGVAAAGATDGSAAWSALDHLEPEDLVRYGFLPEFVGRFATLARVRPLTIGELAVLLTGPEDALLRHEARFCRLHGIELQVTPEALREIAVRASGDGTGARGVVRITRAVLQTVRPKLPELAKAGFNRITVNREVVRGGNEPLLGRGPRLADHGDLLELRRAALRPAVRSPEPSPAATAATTTFTDGTRLSREELRARIESAKVGIAWYRASAAARRWWVVLEQQECERLHLILRLAEELLARNATLAEFHQASTKSRTANVQASLYFLDYLRLKKADEARQRASAPTSAEAAARILEQLALIRAEHFTTKPEDPPSPGRDSTS